MPAAPRIMKSKATKIAFHILGKPKELRRTAKPKTYTQRRLLAEESSKVR